MLRIGLCFIIVALVSVLSSSDLSFAAEKVELKVVYMPKTKYRLKTFFSNNMTIKLENPFAAPEKMRNNFPKTIDSKDETVIDIETGSLIDKNTFPISFEVVKKERKGTINGTKLETEKNKLVGIRALGTTDFNGNMNFTKFEGKNLSQNEQEFLATIFKQMAKSLTQSKTKPVAVGESFTQKVPLNIPIPGLANISLEMTQIYTLESIINGIATFDGTYKLKLLQSPEDESVVNIKASGEGSGKIVYNTEKKVNTNTTSSFRIKGKITIEGSNINISSSSSVNTTTELR